uniref:Uncharacterized protein n=1 Tax=Oryza rufipogon TaxID=4529 RepID=A0A0E0NFH1_ORYRU
MALRLRRDREEGRRGRRLAGEERCGEEGRCDGRRHRCLLSRGWPRRSSPSTVGLDAAQQSAPVHTPLHAPPRRGQAARRYSTDPVLVRPDDHARWEQGAEVTAVAVVVVLVEFDHAKTYYIGAPSESVEQDVMHSYSMAFGGGGFAISYPAA